MSDLECARIYANTPCKPGELVFCSSAQDESVKERALHKRHRQRPDRKNPNPKLSDDKDDDVDDEKKKSSTTRPTKQPPAFYGTVDDAVCSMSRRRFVGPSGLELVSYPWYRPIKKPAAHRTPIGRLRPP